MCTLAFLETAYVNTCRIAHYFDHDSTCRMTLHKSKAASYLYNVMSRKMVSHTSKTMGTLEVASYASVVDNMVDAYDNAWAVT